MNDPMQIIGLDIADQTNKNVGTPNTTTAGTDTLFNYAKRIYDYIGAEAVVCKDSTTIKYSADTEEVFTSATLALFKKFIVPYSGEFSVQCDAYTADTNYSRVKVENVFSTQINKIIETLSTAYVTISTTSLQCKKEDIIFVYGYKGVGGANGYLRNVKLRFDTTTPGTLLD